MIHRIITLLLVVLTTIMTFGCVVEPITLAVHDRFSADEIALIQNAIDQWELATDSDDAHIELVEGYSLQNDTFDTEAWEAHGGSVILKIRVGEPGYDYLKAKYGDFCGMGSSEKERAAIVEDCFTELDNRYTATVLHELGHFYGLHHSDTGIMGPGLESDEAPCIDQAAVDAFCASHVCGPNAGPTC